MKNINDIENALNEIEAHKHTLSRINEKLNSIGKEKTTYGIQSVIALYNNDNKKNGKIKQQSNGLYSKSDVSKAIQYLIDNGKLKGNLLKKVEEEYNEIFKDKFNFKPVKVDKSDFIFVGNKAIRKKCSNCGNSINIINKNAIAVGT